LEGIGYTFGASGLAACNLGAPHQRKRLYFVADSNSDERPLRGDTRDLEREVSDQEERGQAELRPSDNLPDDLGNPPTSGLTESLRDSQPAEVFGAGRTQGFWERAVWLYGKDGYFRPTGKIESGSIPLADGLARELGYCRDGDTGETFISPLVQETPNRVGRLRGYGNAICAPAATAFIEAYQASCR
jgi:DNA (cytosine-5)-methyltransferase 1